MELDSLIESLDAQLKAAKAAKKSGVAVTEIKQEKLMPDEVEVKAEEARKFFQCQVASIERELTRIQNENCLRLGDSTFNEAFLIKTVSAALETVRENFYKLC
jgi:hypothetical protein